MDYEKFYQDICAVVVANHSDPAEFANEVLALVGATNTCKQPNKACIGLAVTHREMWTGDEYVCADCGVSL